MRNGAAFQRQQKEKPAPVRSVVVRSFPIRCWLRAALPFEEEEGRALWQSSFPKTPSPPSPHLLYIWQASPKKTFLDKRRTAYDAGGTSALSCCIQNPLTHFLIISVTLSSLKGKINGLLSFDCRRKCRKKSYAISLITKEIKFRSPGSSPPPVLHVLCN